MIKMAACFIRRGFSLLYTLVLVLSLLVSHIHGKVLRGEVSSRSAWENKGVFLAKFGFHGKCMHVPVHAVHSTIEQWVCWGYSRGCLFGGG